MIKNIKSAWQGSIEEHQERITRRCRKEQGAHNKEVSKNIRNAQQGGVEGTNNAQ